MTALQETFRPPCIHNLLKLFLMISNLFNFTPLIMIYFPTIINKNLSCKTAQVQVSRMMSPDSIFGYFWWIIREYLRLFKKKLLYSRWYFSLVFVKNSVKYKGIFLKLFNILCVVVNWISGHNFVIFLGKNSKKWKAIVFLGIFGWIIREYLRLF